jgi:hypothetical protein
MGTSNDRERHRRAYRALPWAVISLTILALLLRPLLGRIPGDAGPAQQDKGRCDEKGIQKAKDDYAKALKERADANKDADAIAAEQNAAYNEGNDAFNEVWGVEKQLGANELTMHTAARLGSEAAEKIAPALTIAELAELTVKATQAIHKDTVILSKAGDLTLRAESQTRRAVNAIEAAQAALRRQRMLEAECEALKKRKSSSRTSNDDSGDSKGGTVDLAMARLSETTLHRKIWVLSPFGAPHKPSAEPVSFSLLRSELLSVSSQPVPQSYEAADLDRMANREGMRSNAYLDAFGRYTNTKMWLGMAGEAFSHLREQLPPRAETNHQKLTGSKLSECTKWLKVAFENISKGVDSFDGIKSDLEKASQEN